MKLMIINGPNLNMLGIREPEFYGNRTYEDLVSMISEAAEELGVEAVFYQSNHEGDLVDRIPGAKPNQPIILTVFPKVYLDDKSKNEVEYLSGLKSEKGKDFHNRLKYEGEYLDGKRNGKGKEYDINGNLIFEGTYIDGEKQI